MQKCNLDFSLLKLYIQRKIQTRIYLLFSFLYYIMDLSFSSSVPSITGYNSGKYYFYYNYYHYYHYYYYYYYYRTILNCQKSGLRSNLAAGKNLTVKSPAWCDI